MFPSIPKGEIVSIIDCVFSLMATRIKHGQSRNNKDMLDEWYQRINYKS